MAKKQHNGLIQVYTGSGKGKTTAALGLAVRAVGAGLRVAIVYFDKGGGHYSERKVLAERFIGEIDFWVSGLDRIDLGGKFRFGVLPEDKKEADRGLDIVRHLFGKAEYDLVILDEINSTVALGMLDENDVLEVIRTKPESLELVLTGRNAPNSFREIADLVTVMDADKHYLESGIPAREGLDY